MKYNLDSAMKKVLVQVETDGALELLQSLEKLKVLKVIETESKKALKLSERYNGALPAQVAEELQEYVKKSRNEWDR